MSPIDAFIEKLKACPGGPLFNPWFEQDREHDLVEDAPEIRRRQLVRYLTERKGARVLLIAEALGYQGGHFTGIAMTSERILLGHQEASYGVRPDHVFRSGRPARTSKPSVRPNGLSEPTATIVWGAMVEMGLDPYDVVLWNALPWHPYKPDRGLLSNRTPTNEEMDAGRKLLPRFLALFPDAEPVAVGRKCETLLTDLSIPHKAVRHPANGGAPAFRSQMAEWVEKRPARNGIHPDTE
ncbi:MAG: uracil-DNA glycosylase [Bacteroidota bacterium]